MTNMTRLQRTDWLDEYQAAHWNAVRADIESDLQVLFDRHRARMEHKEMSQTAQKPVVCRGSHDISAYNTRPFRVSYADGGYSVLHAMTDVHAQVEAEKRRPGVEVVGVELVK